MIIFWSNSDIDEFRFAGTAVINISTVDQFYLTYALQLILDAEKPNLSTAELDQLDAEISDLLARITSVTP